MKCPRCDTNLSDLMRFCPGCGTATSPPEPAPCEQCGVTSPSGAAFCSGCGREIGGRPVPEPPPPTHHREPDRHPEPDRHGGPPVPGEDHAFPILFLWGLLWGSTVLIFEGVGWVGLNLFDYDLTGSAEEPLKLKVVWVLLGVVSGWMAGIGIGVAARWANVVGGCFTLLIAFVLLLLLAAVELGLSQVMPLGTDGQYLIFIAVDAGLCGAIGFLVALCSGRSGNPVGLRAVYAVPFWVFASVIGTLPFFPPLYEEILMKTLG
jgi:hypothetical protein